MVFVPTCFSGSCFSIPATSGPGPTGPPGASGGLENTDIGGQVDVPTGFVLGPAFERVEQWGFEDPDGPTGGVAFNLATGTATIIVAGNYSIVASLTIRSDSVVDLGTMALFVNGVQNATFESRALIDSANNVGNFKAATQLALVVNDTLDIRLAMDSADTGFGTFAPSTWQISQIGRGV